MSVDISKWSDTRIVARNRTEKAISQSRPITNEIVAHFSDDVCDAIAKAADADVRGLVEAQTTVLKAKALKEHETDVAKTFAMATIAEAVKSGKSPEEIVAAIIAINSYEELARFLSEFDDDAIDRIDQIASSLRLACEEIRAERRPAPPAEVTAKPDSGESPAKAESPASETSSPADSQEPAETATEPPKPETEASEATQDERKQEDAAS